MIKFHPIEFHGYSEPSGSACYKYAEISQRVEYSEKLSENTRKAFAYNSEDRTLLFLLQSNNENFHKLLEATPQAQIVRTISNEPILTTQEQLLVEHGLELLSMYADRQLSTTADGKVILDEYGLPIYIKDRLFLKGGMSDQDLRIPPCAAELPDGEFAESTSETEFFNFED